MISLWYGAETASKPSVSNLAGSELILPKSFKKLYGGYVECIRKPMYEDATTSQ